MTVCGVRRKPDTAIVRLIFIVCLVACVLVATGSTSAQDATRRPPAPGLVFAFEAHVEVGAPIEVGQLPKGMRRIVPILRGTFEGLGIKGRVMPGGADCQF